MRPVTIGISSSIKKISNNFSLNQSVTLVPSDYFSILQDVNVLPLVLSPNISLNHVDEVCSKIDGLFLIGGEDVDPSFYKEKQSVQYENITSIGSLYKRPLLLQPNFVRDQFEIALYLSAKKNKIPILGNCRGMQIINVAEGGSLFQEMPESSLEHLIGGDGWVHYHEVFFEPDSLWESLLEKTVYTTSSCHHQSIKQIAPALQIAGKASDGIIEMIEHKDRGLFILGIQGHIEKLTKNFVRYQRIIQQFIQKAQQIREQRYEYSRKN